MKLKSIGIGVALCILMASAAVFVSFVSGIQDITLTNSELQQMVDRRLPYNTDNVTISTLKTALTTEGVDLAVEAEGHELGQDFSVRASVKANLELDSEAGLFYFKAEEFKIEKLTLKNKLSLRVAGFIDRWIDSKKIVEKRKLIGEKVEALAAKALEKIVKLVLSKIPVHKLEDAVKTNAHKLMIESVRITNGSVIIHLSFWELPSKAINAAASFILGLIVLIIFCMTPLSMMI